MEAMTVKEKLLKRSANKTSSVKRIGEIPKHWAISKLKYIAQIYNGDSLNERQKKAFEVHIPGSLPYIATKDIDFETSQTNYKSGLWVPQKMNNSLKVAPKNSALLCIEGGSAGKKIGFTNQDVCFVNKLACFKIDPALYPKYYFYYLKTENFQRQFNLSMTGLIGGVSISAIQNFDVCVPPIEEQERIAQFLDRKIAQIDQVIGKKEMLIRLLRESRHVLTRNAVTRGLDSYVKMKDSAIEWIGQIPAKWRITRVKYLFRQSDLPPEKDTGVVTAFRDGQVTLRSNRRTEGYTIAILEQGYQGIRKGQLVLNSMDAFEGAIGVSESDGKCTPEYVVCDPIDSEINTQYFAYMLREMALAKYIQVICSAVRERAIRIRFSNLADLFLPVPSIEEQNEIVAFVESTKGKFNALIELQQLKIEKLKEYKATLINSAVTGKIKV